MAAITKQMLAWAHGVMEEEGFGLGTRDSEGFFKILSSPNLSGPPKTSLNLEGCGAYDIWSDYGRLSFFSNRIESNPIYHSTCCHLRPSLSLSHIISII